MSEHQEVKENRLSPELLIGLILVLFFGISLYLRVYLPYNQVFGGEWIKFTGVDAYYHIRLVDSLVQNFPHRIGFDPYLAYPLGLPVGIPPFFSWLLAGSVWLFGLGSPTQHTIDVVGVYFPVFLAALTIIPAYIIGKELFGRWAGVLSAGLIVIMPGEFMGRSILGFTDHHIAETLLAATTMMFLILAIKHSRERGLTFSHLRRRDWATLSKPIIYSLLGGIFLAAYFLTWIGALLFVFIISVFFFTQFVIDHLRHQSTEYLVPVGVIFFLTVLIIYVLFSRNLLSLASLVIALFIPVVLSFTSRLMTKRGIKPTYYPLAYILFGVIGLVIFYFIAPSFFQSVLNRFSIFAWGSARTIIEMQPLFFPSDNFTLVIAWGNFTTGFFLSLVSMVILVYYAVKRGSAEKTLLLVWSLVILFATLGQRRFAYYFAVNVSLLTGYLSWLLFKLNKESHPHARYLNIVFSAVMILFLVKFSNFNPLLVGFSVALLSGYILWQLSLVLGAWQFETPKAAARGRAKPKKRREGGFHLTTRQVSLTLVVIIGFVLVFVPNIGPAIATAEQARFAPSDAWISSLNWMKENTPEPFGDPDFYYQRYESPPPEEKYQYPESAYGVMAWTDYGYWITRIAHRPVNQTPGPGGFDVATFFLSQDEDSTVEIKWVTKWEKTTIPEKEIIEKLDSRYIIIDHETVTTKFWALANWAKKERTEFFDTYYLPREGGAVPTMVFHPEYYRSLAVRLYNFDGQAVTPEESIVISYEERIATGGVPIKLITDAQRFSTYEEATAYVASQESGNYQIVGENPFASPVPLDELKNYKLIYSSDDTITQPGGDEVPSVKIFEYIRD